MTPFTLKTPDDETLYGWHIMPLPVYLKNEEKLLQEPSGLRKDYIQSEAFRILKEDPNARLVIFCKQPIFPTAKHCSLTLSVHGVRSRDHRRAFVASPYCAAAALTQDRMPATSRRATGPHPTMR